MDFHQDKKAKLMNAQPVNGGATASMAHSNGASLGDAKEKISSATGQKLGDDILYLVAKQCDAPKDVFHLMMCCSKDMHAHFKGELIRTDIAWDVGLLDPLVWEPLVLRGSPPPGLSYLCFAIKKGYATDIERIVVEAVRANNIEYINGMSSKSKLSHAMAPLHLAVKKGDLHTCSLLIHAGCNPNVLYKPDRIFPHVNCSAGNHALCFGPSSICRCALTMAIELGHDAIAELLLDHPNLDMGDGKTPFHAAIEEENYSIIHRLLYDDKFGWNPNKLSTRYFNPRSQRPLHIVAGDRGDKGAAIIYLLASRGARLNILDRRGHTPLRRAIVRRNKKHALALLNLGASFAELFSTLSSAEKTWFTRIYRIYADDMDSDAV